MLIRSLFSIMGLCLAAILTGCADDPPKPAARPSRHGALASDFRADEKLITKQRGQRLEHDIRHVPQIESTRPDRIARTANHVAERIKHQGADFDRMTAGTGKWFERDFNRVNKELPSDAEDWVPFLWCDPGEQIPRNAIRFFF